MLNFEFIVEHYLSGVRIDSFLARQLRNYTSWRLHRLVAEGQVTIDGFRAETDQRVQRGQRVTLRLLEPPDKLLPAEPKAVRIVYEDPWLMVVDKPAGLITHPVGEFHDGSLTNALQSHLDAQTKARGLLRAGIVHRLDRLTSGLLVVPKDHYSHRLLSIDFQKGRTSKSYLALVEGTPDFQFRRIDWPIGMRPDGRSVLMSAAPNAIRTRAARTDVTFRHSFGASSLVECELFTGRNHQIRVHLAQAGFPIVGDSYYAANGKLKPAGARSREDADESRHALHAGRLGFQHPVMQVPLEFHAPPPPDFWSVANLTPIEHAGWAGFADSQSPSSAS